MLMQKWGAGVRFKIIVVGSSLYATMEVAFEQVFLGT